MNTQNKTKKVKADWEIEFDKKFEHPLNKNTSAFTRESLRLLFKQQIALAEKRVARNLKKNFVAKGEVSGETSDGYHTFNELYEFRKVYNACLFNEWFKQGKYGVHKSLKHNNGELCFGGGWFIVMATLPTGQISNHYEIKDWDLFKCEERELADKWDGHTPQDVIKRLKSLE